VALALALLVLAASASADTLVVGGANSDDTAWKSVGAARYVSVDTLAQEIGDVGHVVVVPRRSTALPDLEPVLRQALTRRLALVFPEGVLPAGPDGAGALGIREWPLPAWMGLVWPTGTRPAWRAAADGATCVAPGSELRENARWDPVLLAGPQVGVPEAVSGFRLRYHTGPRAGSQVIVLGAWQTPGVDGLVSSLLEDGDRPFLVEARPDYALVRNGEALRVPVNARAGATDLGSYSIAADVTDSSGRLLGHVGPVATARGRAEGRLDKLSAALRIPARARWPAPRLSVTVTLTDADGRFVASETSSVAVWDLGGTRRSGGASVTARRVVTRRGAAPVVTVDADRPWAGLAGGSADAADLEAWRASFRALADAGAGTVRMASAAGTDALGPEAAFRLDAARALVAIDEGLTPEIVMKPGAPRLDELAAIQGLLVSPDDSGSCVELSRHWPVERVVPPPRPLYPGRPLPTEVEATCVAGAGVTRVAGTPSPSVGESVLLALRGCAGRLVRGDSVGPEPSTFRRALCANTLLRLLQPAAPAPPVVLAAPDSDRSPALALGLPVDWGPVPASSASFLPPEARVLIVDGAGTRTVSFDNEVLDRVELTGLGLLSIAAWPTTYKPQAGESATPAEFGEHARLGKGWVARVEPDRESLAKALEWAGIPTVAAHELPGCRFMRAGAPGGEVVAAVPVEGDGGEVELTAQGFTVSATCRQGLPALAAATDRGVWLAASVGSVAVSGRTVVTAPPGCWVAIASLDEAPLDVSREFLVFVECAEPYALKLSPSSDREPGRLEAWCATPNNGQLIELSARGCKVSDGSAELAVEPDMSLAPIVVAPSARLGQAIERLRRLIWG